jgi:hypothetical protein
MRIIITENKIEELKLLIQDIINDELNNLRREAGIEWGLGEMDEINEVESVENIVVDGINKTDGINIYVSVYINTDREELDMIFSMIEYSIEKWMPNAKVHIKTIYL